jgi:NAD(P)-dependent dehydrogenase (short-subunit alcohol dehydrogenase family)
MNPIQLDGRKVVVTGGLGSLGRRVGTVLTARGARVLLLDRAPAAVAKDVAAVIGGVDLANPASAAGAFAQAARQLGGIDGLVNVAGGFAWERIEGGQLDTWDRLYAMNLRTAVLASQLALPHLLAQARSGIVNVGALAAQKAAAGMAAYAASKAGVARLTEAMAEEFKDRGLRVNAVLPSILDTPANRADMPDADASRWVTPDALARVIAFLLSDDALAVTGACLAVNGRV